MARRKARATEQEIEERITWITERICEGITNKALVKNVVREFGLSPSRAREYVQRARATMRVEYAPKRRDAMAESVAQYAELYRRAHADGDWRLCLKIRSQLDKILGLDQKFSVADLKAVIAIEERLAGKFIERERSETKKDEDEAFLPSEQPAEPQPGDDIAAVAEKNPKAALRLLTGTGGV